MTLFGNPVRGIIHPTSWKRPAGNHEPRLVRGFLGPGGSTHDGLDISTGRYGDPLIAAAAGTVIWAKQDGGLYVVIDHPAPYRTLYGHMHDEIVSVGQHVAKGQLIGHLGYSGNVIPPGPGGAHVHFEIFKDNTDRVNPWPMLTQNVRVKVKTIPANINLRSALNAGLPDKDVYAKAEGDRIIRASDGKDLGARSTWRDWGGNVPGPRYVIGITPSTTWRKIRLDGRWLFVGSLLSSQSAS